MDAFSVMMNENLFNIYYQDSETSQVEPFQEEHRGGYSQGQCAIVIERIFSRLYKYLQFKSTTKETFQRHINIDSGYKYLTTDSLLDSDHSIGVYYSDNDEKKPIKDYLRYLTKLSTYENSPLLSAPENEVLKRFLAILSNTAHKWLSSKWNLCPLCE